MNMHNNNMNMIRNGYLFNTFIKGLIGITHPLFVAHKPTNKNENRVNMKTTFCFVISHDVNQCYVKK